MTAAVEDDRTRRRGALWLLFSVLAGLALAVGLAVTIVSLQGPKDGAALRNGNQSLLDPGKVLNYGG